MVKKKSPLTPRNKKLRWYEVANRSFPQQMQTTPYMNRGTQPYATGINPYFQFPMNTSYQQGTMDPLAQMELDSLRADSNEYRDLQIEAMKLKRKKEIRELKQSAIFPQQRQDTAKDAIDNAFKITQMVAASAKQAQPKDDPISEAIKQIVPMAFNALMAPQPDFMDQALKYKQLGDMYASNRTGGTSNEIDLKIEQIRGEREMSFRKLDLENKKFMLEMEQKQNMVNTLVNLGGNVLTAFQGPITQKMNELGQASARHSMAGTVQTSMPQTAGGEPSRVLVKCSCGFKDDMYFTGQPPSLITCPKCGQELRTGTPDEALNVSVNPQELGEGDQKFVS